MKTIFSYEKFLEQFTPRLSKDLKRGSARYEGDNVIWYGTPGKMIVIHKDQVRGMWGNIYDMEKMNDLVELINNSEEKVELGCSYGIGDTVGPVEVVEHQKALKEDRFNEDYEEFIRPDGEMIIYTSGDSELDDYLGDPESFIEDLYELEDDIKEILTGLHTISITNEQPGILIREKVNYDGLSEYEQQDIDRFIEMEENFRDVIEKEKGSIGKYMVQLRDGHHRVFGAISAGETYICVDLTDMSLRNNKGKYELV